LRQNEHNDGYRESRETTIIMTKESNVHLPIIRIHPADLRRPTVNLVSFLVVVKQLLKSNVRQGNL